MSDQINTGGAAFPIIGHDNTSYVHEGMTLRDYVAAKVIASAISGHISHHGHEDYWEPESLASYGFEVADAYLAARGGSL